MYYPSKAFCAAYVQESNNAGTQITGTALWPYLPTELTGVCLPFALTRACLQKGTGALGMCQDFSGERHAG
jgi:hypothetical protein